MAPTGRDQSCRHCGYAIPTTLARCPGCSRSRRTRPLRALCQPLSPRSSHRISPPRTSDGFTADVPQIHRGFGRRERGAHRYRSLLPLAVPLRRLLGLAGVGASAFAAVRGARLVVSLVARPWPSGLPEELWDRSATISAALAGGCLVVMAVTGLLFIAWGVRAYQNLPALGIDNRRYWTVWLVAGWFIPGANFIVPKLLMADVWRGSSPSLPAHPGRSWQRRPVGDVVNQWWMLWLTAPAVAIVGASLVPGSTDDLTSLRLWEAATVVAGVALAGSAAAARQMAGIITVAQARRSELIAWADQSLSARRRGRAEETLALV